MLKNVLRHTKKSNDLTAERNSGLLDFAKQL